MDLGATLPVDDRKSFDPEGVLETLAGEGCNHLVDRESNMNIGGGEYIYPSEVEGPLCAFLAVTAIGKIVPRTLRECIVTAAAS